VRHFCRIFTKEVAAANQLAAASSQQLAVAHPIIQSVHTTEDVAKPLTVNGSEEYHGGGGADLNAVAMAVEDAEHFVSVKHDGIHGALPFVSW
jgi:hypothetical protein